MVHVDLSGAKKFFTAAGPDYKLAALAHETLSSGTGLGADFTGWGSLPQHIKENELDRIVAAAERIRSRSKALVVIGIGGSYLGARAAIEFVKSKNYNLTAKDTPKIFFLGNSLSPTEITEIALS